MKSSLTRMAILMVLAIGVSSCVGKKKYTAAQNRIDKLENDSTQCFKTVKQLQEEHAAYKKETDEKIATLMAQLEQQGTEISEKDMALQLRAQRLRALEDRLRQQQDIVNKLRQTVEEALVNVKDEDLNVEVRNGKVYVSLSDKLLFPSGSANLNKEGKEAIGKVGEVLKNNPKINIDVVGHTDSLGISTARYKDNWDLSVARATTITRLLTNDYGVAGSRLTASGMSKYNPVATNNTPEGRAKNRRTEIVLTPKLEELFKILEGDTPPPPPVESE